MITKNQRESQVEKIAGANAILFSAIDDLNTVNVDEKDLLIEWIAQDVDTAIKILEEVRTFLESRKE